MSDNLEFEISKDYTWYINDLTDEELKTFIENLKLTETNCSAWLWCNRFNLCEIRAEKYMQNRPHYGGIWSCLRDSSIEVKNAKELFEVKSTPTPPKKVMTDSIKIIDEREYIAGYDPIQSTSNSLGTTFNQFIKLNSLINEELNRKPKLLEDTETNTEGMFHTQFYYNKSKHGDNFYQVLKKLPVKNQYHDWEDYYLYKQCGTGLEFLKPVEMFNKEFKKVRIEDEI